jgi:succinoglycan biosynthesis protein ExoV
MKMFYWQEPTGNFGDDLNLWLWPKLLGDLLDQDEQTLFVGIGTILTAELPPAPLKVVFGSGVWFGRPLPVIDEKFDIYCVRGPRSAEVLGLPRETGVIDPGVLVRDFVPQNVPQTEVGFMPHHYSARLGDWRLICHDANVQYIDPEHSVESVLSQIQRCKLLITEAMHGAIIADALRVPWIPVKSYSHILEFKWNDWCDSVELPYEPVRLFPIWQLSAQASWLRRTVHYAKRTYLARVFKSLVRNGRTYLSTQSVLDSRIAELYARLEKLKSRYGAKLAAR